MVLLVDLYNKACKTNHATSAHLPTLRRLAEQCDLAIEFGCKRGDSATALLMGAQRVISYDITPTQQANELQALVKNRWDYRLENTLECEPIPECDLLFVDSLHTYDQVKGELDRHAHNVKKYLVFHDTVTFGSVGADMETGRYDPNLLGIRPAIDHYIIKNQQWRIKAHHTNSHGLLILER